MEIGEALAVLDLKPGASREEIEAAYKAAVKAWHPDRFNHSPAMRDVAEAKLRRLNEAYDALVEARRDGGRSSAAGDDEDGEYVDSLVIYLGDDPRLPPIRGAYSKGRQCLVSVSSRGVALLVEGDPDGAESVAYPAETLLSLGFSGEVWLTEGLKRLDVQATTRPDRCQLLTSDPNGVQETIGVTLGFRNEYHAKLFAKKAVALLKFHSLEVPECDDIRHSAYPSAASDVTSIVTPFLIALAIMGAIIGGFCLVVFLLAGLSRPSVSSGESPLPHPEKSHPAGQLFVVPERQPVHRPKGICPA